VQYQMEILYFIFIREEKSQPFTISKTLR